MARGLVWLSLYVMFIAFVSGKDPSLQLEIGKIGRSINIITGDGTQMKQVVDFTFLQNKLWYDAQKSNPSQAYPDQVTVIPQPLVDLRGDFHLDSSAYYNSKTNSLGLGAEWTIKGAAFSLNTGVSQIQTTMNAQGSAHLSARQKVAQYSAQLIGLNNPVSNSFFNAVNSLPNNTASGPDYANFVQNWGTHVVTSSVLGGSWEIENYVSQSYATSRTALELSINMELELNNMRDSTSFGVQFGRTMNPSNLRDNFLQATSQTIVGGITTTIGSSSSYSSWVTSLRDYPGAIHNTYTLISDFINWDDKKRTSLESYLLAVAKNTSSALETKSNQGTVTFQPGPEQPYTKYSDYYTCPSGSQFAGVNRVDTKKGYMYLPPKCKQFSFSFGNALPPPQTNFGQATTLTFSEMNGIATKEKVASKNMAQNKDSSDKVSDCGQFACFPGTQFLGVGFDIVTALPRPAAVMELTYMKNFSFQLNSTLYNYADQMQRPEPVFADKTNTQVFRSMDDIAQHTSSGFHLSVPIIGTPATLSVGTHTSSTTFFGQYALKALRERTLSNYDVSLSDGALNNPLVSSFFIEMVNALPPTYTNDTKAQYAKFLATFGTHVITAATVGGKSSLWVDVDMSFDMGDTDRDSSISLQVADLYTDMTSSKQTASAAFTAAANAELRFLGGAPEDLSFNSEVNSNDAWAQSVTEIPAPIEYQLLELSQLINDPNRSAGVSKAIQDYVTFYQVLSEKIANLQLAQTNGVGLPPTEYCGQASGAFDSSPHFYENGAGDYWIQESDYCYQLGWHDVETGQDFTENNYISAPYLCNNMYTELGDCGAGVVMGSSEYIYAKCRGDNGHCYYSAGDLWCSNICADNKLQPKNFAYWWLN